MRLGSVTEIWAENRLKTHLDRADALLGSEARLLVPEEDRRPAGDETPACKGEREIALVV